MLDPRDKYDDENWSDLDDYGLDSDLDDWPEVDDDSYFDAD